MVGTNNAVIRRLSDSRFLTRYFIGNGIDIGAGSDPISNYKAFFPGINTARDWDRKDGDAHYMNGIADNSLDWVHSSHCLEHMVDPMLAMTNWSRILKPKGYMIIMIPDEDLYEQGFFPSRFNGDHKTTWTIQKNLSWSPVSINCTQFFAQFPELTILKMELLDSTYRYHVGHQDQTAMYDAEAAIEIILRKNP